MSSSPARVLTVCTGNICRSPFLERARQAELDRSWGPGAVAVSSGGTGALPGHPRQDQARVLLESNANTADGFLARDLTPALVAEADIVLTATRAHRGKVAMLHPKALRYVFAFREFADLVSGLDDSQVHIPSDSAQEHIGRVVALAARQPGMRAPHSDAQADILDPNPPQAKVFEDMTDQIMGSLPTVARALGRP